MKEIFFYIIAVLLLGQLACQKQSVSEQQAFSSVYWADSIPYPERNPISQEGVELGRMLFYDPALSAKDNLSCASCHMQHIAFTDGLALSNRGNSGKALKRHSPALINLAWHEGLFWDGGAKNLESLTFAPLTHPDEMAIDLPELVKKLEDRYDYRARFKQVFKVDTIHAAFIARALAQFQRTLISDNAKYDQVLKSDGQLQFTELELRGEVLFEEKCSNCHSGLFFTDFDYHNNGLDSTFPEGPEEVAQGRARITLNAEDLGRFKTPTLRNVALTAPYMHDGRFSDLEAVLEHYNSGVQRSPSLDKLLIDEHGNVGIPLNKDDKQALIAFLNTLTDSSFLTNPMWSNPFNQDL